MKTPAILIEMEQNLNRANVIINSIARHNESQEKINLDRLRTRLYHRMTEAQLCETLKDLIRDGIVMSDKDGNLKVVEVETWCIEGYAHKNPLIVRLPDSPENRAALSDGLIQRVLVRSYSDGTWDDVRVEKL